MQIIFDGRSLRVYPFGQPGFHGGTETYIARVVRGLAERGHLVHVVTADLEACQQRGPTEFWWPPTAFPTAADAVVLVHSLEFLEPYAADHLIVATNGTDPWLGPEGAWASGVDAWPVFTATHADLLAHQRPGVDRAKCHVTGLGVDLAAYPLQPIKVPGRLLFANDPARGLWHLLDIFDLVQAAIPEATLHVAYDFDRRFEIARWRVSAQSQLLWECQRRLEMGRGVRSLGALSPAEIIAEQLACQVHVMPSEPPNIGSQIHGLTQLECAAASSPLVLSDIEAFPELFGEAATILPLPGKYVPAAERRVDARDWAEVVVELLQDADEWAAASRRARALAEQHTWAQVVERWDAMLASLRAPLAVA